MQPSAEIRWFWKGAVQSNLEEWFHSKLGQYPPGGGSQRLDEYLFQPDQRELGLKKRGENPGVEVKGLIATLPSPVSVGPFIGHVQLWSKWTCPQLRLDNLPLISIAKTRWVRKYNTGGGRVTEIELKEDETPKSIQKLPDNGCNMELTKVLVGRAQHLWWSLGCEAFGSSLELADRNLKIFVNNVLTKNNPSVKGGIEASYPAWISTLSP